MQNVVKDLGLTPVPSSVITSTNNNIVHLLALAYEVADEARNRYNWPVLNRDHTITLVTDQANYDLPADLDRVVFDTMWNENDSRFVYGPLSPQEWKARNEGISTGSTWHKYRIRGIDDDKLYLYPTPSSSDNGNTVIFEYQSTSWIRPPIWVTATAYSIGDYTSWDGIYYVCTGAGTSTGSTGPAGDGGATWSVYSTAYDTFLQDTDVSLLDERAIIGLGMKWMWLERKGLPYEMLLARWEDQIRRRIVAGQGAPTLNAANMRQGSRFLSRYNVPEQGFG